jgi:hypothetical protein
MTNNSHSLCDVFFLFFLIAENPTILTIGLKKNFPISHSPLKTFKYTPKNPYSSKLVDGTWSKHFQNKKFQYEYGACPPPIK